MARGLIGAALGILDRILPDPQARAEAKLKLLEMEQTGELKKFEAVARVDEAIQKVNAKEAESLSLFRAGWRPSIGWVCSLGLLYQFILQPLIAWVSVANGLPPPPVLELGDLMTILVGMLGIGAYRTYEKCKHADKG